MYKKWRGLDIIPNARDQIAHTMFMKKEGCLISGFNLFFFSFIILFIWRGLALQRSEPFSYYALNSICLLKGTYGERWHRQVLNSCMIDLTTKRTDGGNNKFWFLLFFSYLKE